MRKDSLAIKNKKGFSLVEAIVAAAIFSIITTSIVSTYFSVSRYIMSAGAEQQALFLAEEGLEATRNIRDNNFDTLTVGGTHGLLSSGSAWSLSGTQDTRGIYTRKISITAPNADTKEVATEISWDYKGENKNLILKREFTNWRKAKNIDPVSRWSFDDNSGCTADDAIGSNNGTLKPTCPTPLNAPVWNTGTKRVGTSALAFDGTDDYVQVSDDNSLDLSTAGTLMAWIRPTRNATMGIIHKGTATNGSDEAYYLRMDSGRRLTGGGRNSSNVAVSVQTSSLLTLNTWTHVVFTWDATGMKLYINGVLGSPANATVLNARNSSGAMQIGAFYPSTNRFQGTIDEVSIYNVALTQAQISAIYSLQ